MSYNKAREEKTWLKLKEQEEQKLRALGVEEDTIQRLHLYDWTEFNQERQYRQRQVDWSLNVDQITAKEMEFHINTPESLLDSIEDERLHAILSGLDKLTLQIAIYKIMGYSGKEITKLSGIDEAAVNMRIYRLRKKLKKYF